MKKKREDKISELKTFIQRFSSNASKARQATSRKKLIDKLTIDDIKPTSRRYPYVGFTPERECGDIILHMEHLNKKIDGVPVLKDLNLTINKKDKVAFVGPDHLAKTTLFQIVMGELEPDSGSFEWGQTITPSYFPKDNAAFFDTDYNLVEWLSQYKKGDEDETFLRSFFGRMLFTGDETLKKASVLSGGEKVRCMLSRMMMNGGNVLILDEPTNHLDLESITALNNGLISFPEVILFTSHDHQFIDTIANRIIEFTPGGIIDRMTKFDDYIDDEKIKELRDSMYHGHQRIVI